MLDAVQPGPYLVTLQTSHFRFSIGGEHYYGNLQVTHKSENGITTYGSKTTMHPLSNVELNRKLTDQSEVDYLSDKDDFKYYLGMSTRRFLSESDVVDAGVKFFKENFSNQDLLAMSNRAGDLIALAGDLQNAFNLVGVRDQWCWLSENKFICL